MPPPASQSGTLDGLPKPFVGALRTLFDIIDDKGAGFVKFSEIERRWQDNGTKGLPKGVIESLCQVTLPNGLLSVQRFCAGLKICLLGRGGGAAARRRQTSRLVRPNNAMLQQRTVSMAQLDGAGAGLAGGKEPGVYAPGPPKPPRTAAGLERAMQLVAAERGIDKQEIRAALQNWQMGLMMGQPGAEE